jgi:hypothetical protein
MLVKLIDSAAVVGAGKALALCDDDGVMLAKQRKAVVETEAGALSTITVTFVIDGRDIRWA